MSERNLITTGMAEVSVKEIIALEKSVNEKDQLVGALREQIKGLEVKIEEVKADAAEKQQKILITNKKQINRYTTCICGYSYPGNTCSNCGRTTEKEEQILEYKNLDNVIEDIRRQEIKKLGLEVTEFEKKINDLTLDRIKVENNLTFKLKGVEEDLKTERKELDFNITAAKEKIRKHMGGIIDEQVKEIDTLKEELKKVKKDKVDEAVEEARKQEIVDLKERITELESVKENPLGLNWFKKAIYNWLKVDVAATLAAEKEQAEKRRRTNEISNSYPKSKTYWIFDNWMQSWF